VSFSITPAQAKLAEAIVPVIDTTAELFPGEEPHAVLLGVHVAALLRGGLSVGDIIEAVRAVARVARDHSVAEA
jgi:hypothetical protein